MSGVYLFLTCMITYLVVGQDGPCVANKSLEESISQLNHSIHQLTNLIEQRVEQAKRDMLSSLNAVKREIVSEVAARALLPAPSNSCHVDEEAIKREVVSEISQAVKKQLSPIMDCVVPSIGKSQCYSAKSCHEIKSLLPDSISGYFYVKSATSHPVRVYCDMTKSCGGINGGWMRIANFDADNTLYSCPSGLRLFTDSRRRCGMPSDGAGCASASFNVHGIPYQRVCGKVIGYQYRSTDAFANHVSGNYGIDGTYVDGVGITYGRNPRHHIWTFAAAYSEAEYAAGTRYICPCTHSRGSTAMIPSFVGNDYFCDTGNHVPDDPLWDGAGCEGSNTCCSFNNPPWFMKQLSSNTTNNVELRVCRDQARNDEDIGLKIIALYVQ